VTARHSVNTTAPLGDNFQLDTDRELAKGW
jgi:hypothetical protein